MKNNVRKMNRLTLLGWVTTTAIITASAWQLLKTRPPIPLPLINCQSRLTIDSGTTGDSIRFRTHTRYIIYDDMSGVKSDIGTMQVGEKTYRLNRNYNFHYRNVQHSMEVTFTDVIKKPSDNAPDNEALLNPDERIAYHFTLENLSNGTYMIKLIGVPFVLCGPR
ncbi:TPA: hypothetical protein ACXNDR_001459 [Serratia marcescens]